MKRGLILTNAYYFPDSVAFQVGRISEELLKLGVFSDIKRNDEFRMSADGNIRGNLGEYDFIVYLDKDKYISEMLERRGFRLFNRHDAIRKCDDKMRTFIALSGLGIPMPKTVPGLLCFDEKAELPKDFANKLERELGYPMIVKTVYGSLGKGVFMARDRAELLALAERLKLTPHLFQQCVSESLGSDVRVTVVGGKAIAAMRRRSDKDFRSNIGLGAVGEKIDLDDRIKSTAEKAASALGLDYCGLDILTGKDGIFLCEVNSNAFFKGTESVTGVNVAQAYARHICSEIYKNI